MKLSVKALGIASILTLLVASYGVLSSNTTPSLLVTSDIHISGPGGRWPHTTIAYRSFVDSLRHHPEVIFVVGDVVDNVILKDGRPVPGGTRHWNNEFDIFNSINDTMQDTAVMYSYGPGHDFIGAVNLGYAQEHAGAPSRGVKRWREVDLIWLTVRPAVFATSGNNQPAFKNDDYEWLEDALKSTDNAILLWHVPVRTIETEQAGKWQGDTNLTIPHSDRIYRILDRHSKRILAIFNGHIHKPILSRHKGIPVYLCPFYKSGCHCRVHRLSDSLRVEPEQCGIPGIEIPLNRQVDSRT